MFLNKKIFFVLLSFLCFLGEVRSSEITEDTTFYFVRHGHTPWDMSRVNEGQKKSCWATLGKKI